MSALWGCSHCSWWCHGDRTQWFCHAHGGPAEASGDRCSTSFGLEASHLDKLASITKEEIIKTRLSLCACPRNFAKPKPWPVLTGASFRCTVWGKQYMWGSLWIVSSLHYALSRSSPLLYNGVFKFQDRNMVTSLKSELVKVMIINLEYSILGTPVSLVSNTLDISL